MRLLARVPERWRQRLDNIYFWLGVAYFALVAITVWLAFVSQSNAQTAARQAKAEAIRIAEQRSAAESAYRRCIEGRAPTLRVSRHVAGVNAAFEVLLRNSRAVLEATPKDDPQFTVRRANYRRFKAALADVAAVRSFPVPTVSECKQRRREALRGVR